MLRKTPVKLSQHVFIAFIFSMQSIAFAESDVPTISVHKLPEILLKQYEKIHPQLTDRNRCFVTFTDTHDAEKMLLECSFNTRIAAESERRALKYCNEKRLAKGISSPCRLVID
jgi:hypothetical protein